VTGRAEALFDLAELIGGHPDELQKFAFYAGGNIRPGMAGNRKSGLAI
jgi:hypothetical protein